MIELPGYQRSCVSTDQKHNFIDTDTFSSNLLLS